jgi:hypothetical protein
MTFRKKSIKMQKKIKKIEFFFEKGIDFIFFCDIIFTVREYEQERRKIYGNN